MLDQPSTWGPGRSARSSSTRFYAILLCALLFVAADEDPTPRSVVIPPGQEELLAGMLGRGVALPGPCILTACGIDHGVVSGTYQCVDAEVVFELHNLSEIPAVATRTLRFALVVRSGVPPPGLAAALESRIRSREAAFVWLPLVLPKPAWMMEPGIILIVASVVLLVRGTYRILRREAKACEPAPYVILALLLVWMVALALRLWLSPRTFLHEYYPFGSAPNALAGMSSPAYGFTGPSLFHFVATVLQRPDDVQVIFLTNAVISSLAIPAVALLDLALMGSWPRAFCAAGLLCVLPLHLRFSAGEDVFIQAVTFGLWALGLFALYLNTRRLGDALVAALALSLAIQTRPEMMFLPAACVALVLVAQPRSWRLLVAGRTLFALAVVGMLQLPRLPGLREAAHPQLINVFPTLHGYLNWLVLFQSQVTPAVYWLLLVVGLTWGVWRKPGVCLWVIVVFVGYTLFSCSNGDNPPYNLRTQLVPTSLTILIAAGTASVWMELWGGRYRRPALAAGACALVGLGIAVVVTSRGFVTELGDQQLEWVFLERTVPQLPEQATLLWAGAGPTGNDSLPQFLLRRAAKTYEIVDARHAADGEVAWPAAGENRLYYQGMYCYVPQDHEPLPNPMNAFCTAIQKRYLMEPLLIEDLYTFLYSRPHEIGEARGPFRIGFFRLKADR